MCLAFVAGMVFAKDVYVRAGSSGDGSMTKPYGSIAEAMDMGLYTGDVVHVAQGLYYGKGGSGKWIISKGGLSFVGGYKADFSERDPWKYKSILMRGVEEGSLAEAKKRNHDKVLGLDLTPTKASYNGVAMIQGEGEHPNTVIDGFVVDGYTRNTYRPNGDLKTDVGPIGSPLISLNSTGCRVRNCMVLNSGGPGIRLGAYGQKDKPETWSEVSNTIIVNTLMEALDFRVGNMDPTNAPEGGYALVKDNTIAFVWSWLGEGYAVLVGRQTNLSIENNIIAFASDYAINNGFANNKARLNNNAFFNNMAGTYRFFDSANKITVVEDDPAKFSGLAAKRSFYLSSTSGGNLIQDPKLKADPAFFDRFTNQIKSEGGGKVVWDEVNQWRSMMGLPLIGSAGSGAKNYAPVYEQAFLSLFGTAAAGAKADPARVLAYASTAVAPVQKTYTKIAYADLKLNLGKDIVLSTKIGPIDTSFYVEGVTRDGYIAYRTPDRQHFIYVAKASEALEVIQMAVKDGAAVLLNGKLVDIGPAIKMTGKYAIVVDTATFDE